MASIIDQIKNRLELLKTHRPLVPVIKMPPIFIPPQPIEKIVYPESRIVMTLENLEPKQKTMEDVQEIDSSYKPIGTEPSKRTTTGAFKPRRK